MAASMTGTDKENSSVCVDTLEVRNVTWWDAELDTGSFKVPSEVCDLRRDGVAITPSQTRTWCCSMDDGRK